MQKEEGRRKREEGRRKKEEGRKREEGRRKEEGRRRKALVVAIEFRSNKIKDFRNQEHPYHLGG